MAGLRQYAEELVEVLRPGCERIEIAGALRRGIDSAHDIDIVLEPKRRDVMDLFGEPYAIDLTPWHDALSAAILRFDMAVIREGSRLVTLYHPEAGVSVDLFIVTPGEQQWGAILAIRTGPREFSHLCVKPRWDGGAMPMNMRQKDAALWRGKTLVETPEERDWFAALDLPYWEPQERTAEALQRHLAEAKRRKGPTVIPTSRAAAIHWAQGIANDPSVIFLDTETTGIGDDAEIVELGVVTAGGNVLLDRLVKATKPIPPEATAVHGITDEMMAFALPWPEVWDMLGRRASGFPTVVVYNADFDRGVIERECKRHGIPVGFERWECAMKAYAEYAGDWDQRRRSYRWHKLGDAQARFTTPSNTHRAVDDARACRDVVLGMAAAEQ